MASSHLCLHAGAREVTLEELRAVPTPPATTTWFPVAHGTVTDLVTRSLSDAGFQIEKARFGLSRSDARMFATLDLATGLGHGVTLSVGVRNSLDKSLPLGFVAGSRTFVCDNLAFRSDLLVARKHTRFGSTRFQEAICKAVSSLTQFKETERLRIKRFVETEIGNERAESMILRAYEQDIISHRVLPQVIKEWRKPSFEDFQARTLWSLFNAFTSALSAKAKSNPQQFASQTMRLNGLFGAEPQESVLAQSA